MHYIKIFVASILLMLSGCATLDCKPINGSVLPGTDTAIVGIYIDKNGYPQASVDEVTVYPGQKIVFSGPNQFDIVFKDQKSPIDVLEVKSTNGIVVITIPRDILERNKTTQTTIDPNARKGVTYRYGIRANGKITDPSIRIEPR